MEFQILGIHFKGGFPEKNRIIDDTILKFTLSNFNRFYYELRKYIIFYTYDTFSRTQKTSFNYILLDPRVTKNLADRVSEETSFIDKFQRFASAIFYIGKGKKSRPYEHFHEAVKHLKGDNPGSNNKQTAKVRTLFYLLIIIDLPTS